MWMHHAFGHLAFKHGHAMYRATVYSLASRNVEWSTSYLLNKQSWSASAKRKVDSMEADVFALLTVNVRLWPQAIRWVPPPPPHFTRACTALALQLPRTLHSAHCPSGASRPASASRDLLGLAPPRCMTDESLALLDLGSFQLGMFNERGDLKN